MFIKRQVEAYQRWTFFVVGGVVSNELEIEGTESFQTRHPIGIGDCKELLLWHAGWSPSLKNFLSQRKVKVFHAHFGNSGYAILPFVKKLGIPLVVTFHGMDAAHLARTSSLKIGEKYYPDKVLRKRYQELFDYSSAIIGVSRHVIACLRRAGAPEDKLIRHYIGVEVDTYKREENGEVLRLLFVGRFVEKKGILDLVEALERLGKQKLELILAGGGEMEGLVSERLKCSGISHRFLGVVGQEEVKKEMLKASLLVVPSKTSKGGDQEGLPTVIAEAMACGLPVLGTRHAGIPEIISDGETGLLVDEGDVNQLADALQRLLHGEIDRSKLAHRAFENISENFNVDKQSAKLEEIYDAVVAGRLLPKEPSPEERQI